MTFFGEGWVLDPEHVGPSLRQPVALSWEGKTWIDPFPFDPVPFLSSGGAALGAG